MKKFIMRSSFALVMCCLLFAACSKDDNTDVNTASVTDIGFVIISVGVRMAKHGRVTIMVMTITLTSVVTWQMVSMRGI